jgi:hypothetical protein
LTGAAKRQTWLSFLIPVLTALLLRLVVAGAWVFRPDGFDGFANSSDVSVKVSYLIAATVPVWPLAFVIFAIVRLWKAAAKLVTAGALLLSLAVSVALFFVGFGEPFIRLALHRTRYDAAVAAHAADPAVVFDWGATPTFPLGRRLDYLAFARGGEALATLRHFEAADNGGREADIQDDEYQVKTILADAWDPATVQRRFKSLVLDACRLNVSHLTGGYFYVVDDC